MKKNHSLWRARWDDWMRSCGSEAMESAKGRTLAVGMYLPSTKASRLEAVTNGWWGDCAL